MLLDWLGDHETVLWWLAAASVVMFIGSLIAIPWLVTVMPADYFVNHRPWRERLPNVHPAIRIALLVLKNLVGLVLVVLGVVMIFTPGQGVLAIVIGITLMNFPGKRRIELWLIRRKSIHRAIDWVRKKRDKPPIELPEESAS